LRHASGGEIARGLFGRGAWGGPTLERQSGLFAITARSTRAKAAHPSNAVFNYAYATLESEIRIKAIFEGYDPTIGIMHEGRDFKACQFGCTYCFSRTRARRLANAGVHTANPEASSAA